MYFFAETLVVVADTCQTQGGLILQPLLTEHTPSYTCLTQLVEPSQPAQPSGT